MATVLKTRLERFLDQEALRCEKEVKQVLYLERKFDDVMSLGGEVCLSYRVDRVDEMMDGTILNSIIRRGAYNPSPKAIDADVVFSR